MGITLQSTLVCNWENDPDHDFRDIFKATSAHVGPNTSGDGWREAVRMEIIAFKRGLKNLDAVSWNIPDTPHFAVSLGGWGGFNDNLQHVAYREICEYLEFPEQRSNYDGCSYAGYNKGKAWHWRNSPDFDGMKFVSVVKFVDYVFEHWMIIDLPKKEDTGLPILDPGSYTSDYCVYIPNKDHHTKYKEICEKGNIPYIEWSEFFNHYGVYGGNTIRFGRTFGSRPYANYDYFKADRPDVRFGTKLEPEEPTINDYLGRAFVIGSRISPYRIADTVHSSGNRVKVSWEPDNTDVSEAHYDVAEVLSLFKSGGWTLIPTLEPTKLRKHELEQGVCYKCSMITDGEKIEYLFIFDELKKDTQIWAENWLDITESSYDRSAGWCDLDESTITIPTELEQKWHQQCVYAVKYVPFVFVEPIKTHNKFPENGFTRSTTKLLKDFLEARKSNHPTVKEAVKGEVIGIAWNPDSAWTVSVTSSKHEYQWAYIKQLITNLNNNNNQLNTSKNNENLSREISRPTQRRRNNRTRQTTSRREPNSITERRSRVEKRSRPKTQRVRRSVRSKRDRL